MEQFEVVDDNYPEKKSRVPIWWIGRVFQFIFATLFVASFFVLVSGTLAIASIIIAVLGLGASIITLLIFPPLLFIVLSTTISPKTFKFQED